MGFGLHCDGLVDGTRGFVVLKNGRTLNKKVAGHRSEKWLDFDQKSHGTSFRKMARFRSKKPRDIVQKNG